VFRLAVVLTRLELLEQNGAGAYSLGLANLRLAGALLAGLPIRALARPAMERLRDALNETVVLSLRDGDFRYNIDSVESTRAIGQTQQIGAPIPLYAGAASRAILAAMPSDEREAYIARASLRSFSEATITDPESLREQIERTRRRGYVVTAGEFTAHSHAVARLIQAPPRYGLSALHVSIPPARFSKSLERRAIAGLAKAVAEIESASQPA
jgi:DNA-binding IclR family transcriptional regulator